MTSASSNIWARASAQKRLGMDCLHSPGPNLAKLLQDFLENAVLREHFLHAAALGQLLAHLVFADHFLQGAGKCFLGQLRRHDHHALDIAEDPVAFAYLPSAHMNRLSVPDSFYPTLGIERAITADTHSTINIPNQPAASRP